MKTKLMIWNRNICQHCTRRASCGNRDNITTRCSSFKDDAVARRELIVAAKKKLDDIRKTFLRVQPDQLDFDSYMRVQFFKLDDETLKSNSRQGKREVVDALTYRKFCEQCGASFETLNTRRKLCNACHDEICERLGVNYAMPKCNDFGEAGND